MSCFEWLWLDSKCEGKASLKLLGISGQAGYMVHSSSEILGGLFRGHCSELQRSGEMPLYAEVLVVGSRSGGQGANALLRHALIEMLK